MSIKCKIHTRLWVLKVHLKCYVTYANVTTIEGWILKDVARHSSGMELDILIFFCVWNILWRPAHSQATWLSNEKTGKIVCISCCFWPQVSDSMCLDLDIWITCSVDKHKLRIPKMILYLLLSYLWLYGRCWRFIG